MFLLISEQNEKIEKPKNVINAMYGDDDDTDDEIEDIKKKEAKQEGVENKHESAYDLDTDDEIDEIKKEENIKQEKIEEEAYDQETDEEIDESHPSTVTILI